MKKRIFTMVMLFVLMLSMSVQAAENRIVRATPSLQFDGTTALCSIDCKSGNVDDELVVTLTLFRGNTRLNTWTESGTRRVTFTEEHDAESGKEYKLVLSFSVNGVAQSSVTVKKTCP